MAAGSSTHFAQQLAAVDDVDREPVELVFVGEIAPQRIVGLQRAHRLERERHAAATAGTRRGRRPALRRGSARRRRACRRACGRSARTSTSRSRQPAQPVRRERVHRRERAPRRRGRARRTARAAASCRGPRTASCPRASPCRHSSAPSRGSAALGLGLTQARSPSGQPKPGAASRLPALHRDHPVVDVEPAACDEPAAELAERQAVAHRHRPRADEALPARRAASGPRPAGRPGSGRSSTQTALPCCAAASST